MKEWKGREEREKNRKKGRKECEKGGVREREKWKKEKTAKRVR